MLKKITSIFLTTISLSLSGTVYFPQGISINDVHIAHKNNIQIAWDIHNVLAVKDPGTKFFAIFKHIFPILGSKIGDNAAWNEINRLTEKNDISGQAYFLIFLKHGEKKLAKMAQETANAYKPREGIEHIVRAINNSGITQRLASNIGPEFLANLNAKFKNKHKSYIFDFIKPGMIVDYSRYCKIAPSPTTNSLFTSFFCKPHFQFYSDFNKAHATKFTIFIDDKLENVQTALKAGWIGIHLDVNKKSKEVITQLQSDLNSLRIFNKEPIRKFKTF